MNAFTLLVLFCVQVIVAVDTLVDVGYSKYRGVVVGDGTSQWLGIRYAAPPLGELRFAAPQKPVTTNETQDASKFQPLCLPGSPTDWTTKPSSRFTIAEDCLYLNVFAPSNATSSSKLPVMFFIQGGGFNSNSNNNFNGSDLARVGNMVVVSINYRVGPFGFLHSKQVGAENSNVGIRDMVIALEWVRDNVAKFGGNPNHVVIVGDSAGAEAVVILMVAPSVRAANLFVGAIGESTPVTGARTPEQMEKAYNCLLYETGCPGGENSLDCFRQMSTTTLQTNCSFSPHIDTDFLPDTPFRLFSNGSYLKIPSIFGTCADEGTKQAPQTIDTVAEANDYILSKASSLTNSSISVLDDLYINKDAPVFPNSGRKWRQMSNLSGDLNFHCPTKIFQTALAKGGVPTWNYHYAVRDPDQEAKGFGAYHTVELNAVWGPNNTDGNPPKSYNTTNAAIVPVVQGYWTSFIRHLDPNTQRKNSTPMWEKWGDKRERILFVTNGTKMETMDDDQAKRCAILDPLERVLEQQPPNGTKTELNSTNSYVLHKRTSLVY